MSETLPGLLEGDDPIFGFYQGKIEIVGDMMSPIYTDQEYEEFLEASWKANE